MTYLAPRQGLFAMIILMSMSLHLLFFVLSQEHKLTQYYQHVVEREAVALASELTMSLNKIDKVGISVIAGRYVKNDNIEFISVFDAKGGLLVPIGQEANQGVVGDAMITLSNKVLGSVKVYAPKISRATIISDNWLFLTGVFVLHVLIFLIYGYVARPTKSLQLKMTKDIRAKLLSSGVILPTNAPAQPPKPAPVPPQTPPKKQPTTTPVYTPDPLLKAVQIRFEDNHGLLETVDHHIKTTYFALCDELLQKAVKCLLELPLLTGVSAVSIEPHTNTGTLVVLQAQNPQAKVAIASVMLAELMLMLSQIVNHRYRELQRFCLPIRTLVSDIDKQEALSMVAKKHREKLLILVLEADLKQIAIYSELGKLSELTTVDERESRYLHRVSPAIGESLEAVRRAVLLSES